MARIIAIDYGSKRVGLAVTDPLQMIAGPLDTVHSKDVIAYLKAYLEREEVALFVLGKPLQMDGSDSESARLVENFLSLLRKNFPAVPVERVDERFTSKMAQRTLINAGKKKKDRQDKSLLDKISATLILQSYLDSRMYR
ncbi:MAG: Holliday junction resolvase RuvX [Bacteroidia bacterium]|nr:Holliday junction resolvase RuvX [Bacteroidia bacterium]